MMLSKFRLTTASAAGLVGPPETVSRALLASSAPKAAGDTLTVAWTHNVSSARKWLR